MSRHAITLIFSTASGIISWLIRKLQGADISHCAIGTSMHGVPVVIEDTVGGVRIYPRARWEKSHKLVREFEFIPNMEDGLRHSIGHVGDAYDYAGLFGYVWVLLGRWLRKKWKNPFARANSAVCSEFILEMDPERKLVPEWEGLDPSSVTPRDLDQLCRLGRSFRPRNLDQGVVPPGDSQVG